MALLLALLGHGRHEDAGTADVLGAIATQTGDLAGLLIDLEKKKNGRNGKEKEREGKGKERRKGREYLVVLEGGEFDLLVLVRVLLGRFVDFFLTLLATTTQAEHKMQSRL